MTGRRRTAAVPQVSTQELNKTFAAIVTDATRSPLLTLPCGLTLDHGIQSFSPISVDQVSAALSAIDAAKSTGHDELPALVLKQCSTVLAPSLTRIFNMSLSLGCVPSSFKIANITPLHKGGSKTDPANFRPISLLPIVSKILERFVQQQMTTYLQDHGLLPETQFAYRRHHSTEDAACFAVNRWLLRRHERSVSGLAFVDMSKAFDRVKHQYLIEDLFNLGVAGTSLRWFASYLSERRQRVVVGDSRSSYSPCTQGVPQGSVLGPLLFTIYVRNVGECLPQDVEHQEFADDFLIEVCGKTCQTVAARLGVSLEALNTWMEKRGLLLNQRKTCIMFVRPRGDNTDPPHVQIQGTTLTTVKSYKYLGLVVDDELSWKPHLCHVKKTVRQFIGSLWRARHSLTSRSKSLFYSSMIESRLTYASNAFIPSSSAEVRKALLKLSQLALKTYSTPTSNHVQVDCLYCRKLCVFVYRCVHSTPSLRLISPLFSSFYSVSTSVTRGGSSALAKIPFWRGPSGRSTIQFLGAIIWNDLPSDARTAASLSQFKFAITQLQLSLTNILTSL